MESKASCLCGKVKISVNNMPSNVGACHCGMCRKWSGSAYMAIDCGTEVKIDGTENISIYNSSDWAERGFCKNCGSNLFYRLKENQQYMVSAGLFEDPSSFMVDHQIFIDKKAAYYTLANDTKNMTEAEVFARYGGE